MSKSALSSFTLLIFFLSFSLYNNAQNNTDIFESYEEYIDAPREVVYLHLNKSTYVKGENIGFTAYVLDKKEKTPSMLTTNLYVSISDKNNNEIKQKLVKVTNGVASNIIKVDSLFSSGIYNVKAYTNYMRNFNEPNYYTEAIRIIDPEVDTYIENPLVENDIDAQFLPESGHLLHGIVNNVGVVIKDSQGFGLANISGEVVDANDEVISTFKTNELGISKFPLMADIANTYKVNIKYANEDFSFPLGHVVKKNGVVISVKRLKTKLFASIITNKETLNLVKNKRYTLMLHNGDGYEIMDIYFTDNTTVTKSIEYANIPTGTNIITLFNEYDQPIAERLFFNYNGIDTIRSTDIAATRQGDSIAVKLNFKGVDPNQFNNISISALPNETKAYNRHHNILSQTFLQPYLKGAVEYGKYYFENVDEKKRYDLDNLLLTQGWSSFDWNNLFLPEKLPYAFEQGISVKANVNNPDHREDTFILHHFNNNEPRYKKLTDGNTSFIFENIFPDETNKLLISRLKKDDKMVPAQLYLQSVPSKVPYLNLKLKPLEPKSSYKIAERLKVVAPKTQILDEVQQLDEVVVTSKLDEIRIRTQKLSEHRHGQVKVVTESDKLTFLYLEDWLEANRVNVFWAPDTGLAFSIQGSGGSVSGGGGPLVYFNDFPLTSTEFLYKFPLAEVDYVEINRRGIGEGARGGNGVLRIYASYKSMFSNNDKKTSQKFEIPLTFASNKKFYVPKYQYYNDAFFKGYGTIDWKPELSVNSEGNISFKIKEPQVLITLFIEGLANDGSFIVEEKTISLN
ncbi:hypothetical protein [Winogradskyella alexanderae]|uniref:MG2 domain-containing protein n=1 Tax=Winogradskyella alexanderae TaxID=2877123 RepID=A0ABS7XN30_9FLAO|nr:hypothetical protein [Winogradskyella alexanderae]MCA0131412.1 hypothetical protein [Winogradskyella alexanderae]